MVERPRGVGKNAMSFLAFRAEEYRATMDSLNLFFGAIVGVVFAGLEGLPPRDFASLLVATSVVVSLILLAVHSRRRLVSLANLLLSLAGYWYLFYQDAVVGPLSPNLFITLATWAALAVIYEFSPRIEDPAEA